jgi:two-component system aerobic respiration control sensor histidine kinase ArcB
MAVKPKDLSDIEKMENFLFNWSSNTKEAVICLSLDLYVLEFNPVAERIFKEIKKNAIGQHYLAVSERYESIGMTLPNLNDFLPLMPNQKLINLEISSPNGQLIISWKILQTLDFHNAPNGFMLIGEDITRLKNAELAFRKSEESTLGANCELANFNKLVTGQNINSKKPALEYMKNIYNYMEYIVASMPVSVYWMNREGVYLGCDDKFSALFNLKSRHEIVGKTYEDLYDDESGNFYQSVDNEVMHTGIAKTLEEPLFNADGTKTIWLSSKVPLFDVSGQIIGMLGTSLDITERKKTEDALNEAKIRAEAASLAKSEFLAVISHELRIPLTSILGMTQLLSTKNLTSLKQHEYLNNILTAGMHLLNLINDSLDFAKLEAAQLQVSSAPMDLKTLIEEVSTMLTPLAKAKNLELLIHFEQMAPHKIQGDKRLLRQIMINLVGNAIKFTERGYVSIQVECIEQTSNLATFVISVIDTGIGIPEEKQGMIFEHFSQVDASHSRRYGGAGLGLTITKQLVELMSGTISVTSQIAKGSTFRCVIEFALQKEAGTQMPWMAYESTARILIVDDTPRGNVIQRQLSPSNSQVVSSNEAFSTLLASYQLSDPYDIVIVQQRLENVDSCELARLILQHEELYQPMLVILIDDGSVNTKNFAKAAGFYECLTKPIQPFALQVILTAAWENWVEQREMKSLPIFLPFLHGETNSMTDFNNNNVTKLKVLLVEDDEIVQIIHNN